MRIALVSPYSWSHPGGVTRHIEALTAELIAAGHEPRVLAPFDGNPRDAPEWLIPLGGTIGLPFNGAVSRLALTPFAASTLRRELRAGGFDVVHVHEPVAPLPGWLSVGVADAPLVGTFHTYSNHVLPHAVAALWGSRRNLNRLRVRIAVSEAAAWTGRRFFGGEYRIVPNGVVVPDGGAPAPRHRGPREPLEIAFVGQAVERKGLPVLLRAFEAVREQVPVRLSVIGVDEATLAPLLADPRGVRALGRIDDAEKHAALVRADVLCAPSLGGESFGMVLTEAFAAGTPVVASDIAGYRDVVEHGTTACSSRRATPLALAEALHDLALDPPRLERLGGARGASRRALRVAACRRAGDRGLRGRDRRPGARPGPRAPRSASGCAPPTAVPGARRAGCRRSSPGRPGSRAPSASPAARRSSRRRAAVAGGAWLALSASAGTPSPRRCSRRARRGCCWRSR